MVNIRRKYKQIYILEGIEKDLGKNIFLKCVMIIGSYKKINKRYEIIISAMCFPY